MLHPFSQQLSPMLNHKILKIAQLFLFPLNGINRIGKICSKPECKLAQLILCRVTKTKKISSGSEF